MERGSNGVDQHEGGGMIFVSIALVWIGGFLIGIAAGLWMAERKAQREKGGEGALN